jgi:hypothetical protein
MNEDQKQKMRENAQTTKPHTKKRNAAKKIIIKNRLL